MTSTCSRQLAVSPDPHDSLPACQSHGQRGHQATVLVETFNQLFASRWRTRLEPGGLEPLYQPASGEGDWHRIIFTRDYFASALHEVAHWCIAGPERRQQLDYGYWYAPDGRDRQQQCAFEQSETKPQALEWVFSRAAGFRFQLSADNLEGDGGAGQAFREAVWQQARWYCRRGLPSRAEAFTTELASIFGTADAFEADAYQLEHI